jgi:uncharacterized HAD superfamily protein
MEPDEKKQTLARWKAAASKFYKQGTSNRQALKLKAFNHLWCWAQIKIGIAPMEQITKTWLRYNGFEYDKLIIEKASDTVADPQVHFVNRFYIARRKRIRFFVEDDLEKATKLAHICDVILLFDQPYNQNPERRQLPANMIRVKSWDEVFRQMRRLS